MLILDVLTHWSSTHQMMHKLIYIYIFVGCNLIKPITHRTCIAIQSWDQWFCYALCKSGPPPSWALRGQVVFNQTYIWLAWEVPRCNDADVHNPPTDAITYTCHLSWPSGASLQVALQFAIGHWPVHPEWASCCLLQAGWVLLSVWPIPLLYLGYVYICVIFDHAHIPEVFDPRITYEGLKLDFANDPILLADLTKSKLCLREYYNKYYATLPVSSADANNVCSKSPATLDFIACYKSIIPDAIDKLDKYFKIKRKDFQKCNPLRWWRS